MGVVNVTPDSFSDGGVLFDPDGDFKAAIEHARELVAAGAQVIDVGGESTRPGADPVPEAEELRRVMPVVEALASDGIMVSVDTSKAQVARTAVEGGAALVNDISAGALDGLMLPTVAELGVPYVAMHMRGTPRTMQRDPRYADVVGEVFDFLAETVERAAHVGIDRNRVIVDPGIGFGKTVDHNLALLRSLRDFTSLGRPVLVGTSRKSFLGRITGVEEPAERLIGSVVSAAHAALCGAAIVRVHDVAETVRALRLTHAIATAT
ncbi:MAG: dihydropteroate synthase [Actinobacteria bacterium]|nr:dihydropteroate synthase [Actinomycetota bacterium]